MSKNSNLYLITFIIGFVGCSQQPEQTTLAALDVVHATSVQSEVFVPHKSEEEVKKAYYAYLENARTNDRTRLLAMGRLAELEIDKANAALKASTEADADDEVYLKSLRRTRDLLTASLRDYPDDPENDRVLYRLARIQDQLGNGTESLRALSELAEHYPESVHYAEAQFRIAERAFLEGDYISSEDAYTEVINTLNNGDFRQRSYFKRGWARYKQGIYTYAADDHLQAIREQNFSPYKELDDNDRGIFEEHFRALALTFAQMEDSAAMAEFFSHEPEDNYYYHTSRALSGIYLQQERFFDAARVLNDYAKYAADSEHAAVAQLQVVNIWKAAGFRTQYLDAVEAFYTDYHAGSDYWVRTETDASSIAEEMKGHVTFVAGHFHNQYLKDKKEPALRATTTWYERYLNDFSAQARKDNIYVRYGDLLASTGRSHDALRMYELAAYDGDIVLDKPAAYATITLSHQLYQADLTNSELLNKHLQYATRFAQLFPNDPEAGTVALHAAEMAFKAELYPEAITLSNLLNQPQHSDTLRSDAQLIKARSMLELDQLSEAEELLVDMLDRGNNKQIVADNLALVLYRKGEAAQQGGEPAEAVKQFAQIAALVPGADIAPQGLYDAIVLAMESDLWEVALQHMRTFEALFPKHPHADDVVRRQSVAYMQAEQYAEAAEALEKVSTSVNDAEVQMAALWKAAELYENDGNTAAAIRTYRSYAHTYTRPYPQYIEAMYKLTQLYDGMGDEYRRNFWEQKIVDAERTAPQSIKSDRTNFIAANTWLALGHRKKYAFEKIKLVEPLAANLRRKKEVMQEAINLYSQASNYNNGDVSTESTYAIASIYHNFSQALLDSERPSNLTGEQLVQYDILIEDQAFPFEEMAVEFHEINVSRIGKGTVNQWVTSSLNELRTLFPVRYAREGKASPFRQKIK